MDYTECGIRKDTTYFNIIAIWFKVTCDFPLLSEFLCKYNHLISLLILQDSEVDYLKSNPEYEDDNQG